MRWFKTRRAREEEEREDRRYARREAFMRDRRMYNPKRNPLIRISLGLGYLAEREDAFRENDRWTQDMLNKARGLGAVSHPNK